MSREISGVLALAASIVLTASCNPSRGVRRADSEPSVCVIHRIQISCSVLKPEATGPPRFIAGSAHQRRSPVLPVIFFVSGEKSFDERIADFCL